MKMKKEWRPIEGFKDYEISNYGEIRKWIDIFGDVQMINPITLGGVPELRNAVTLIDEDDNPVGIVVHRELYKAFKPEFYDEYESVRYVNAHSGDKSLKNLYTDAEIIKIANVPFDVEKVTNEGNNVFKLTERRRRGRPKKVEECNEVKVKITEKELLGWLMF